MDTPPGQAIVVSLQVAKSMSLARQGKVKEAEALLAVNPSAPVDPLSLEVLAVIVTAQGDYRRGLSLWQQLLRLKPQHAEAKRMVACIELWLGRPSWARYVPAVLATLIALLVIGLFLALTWEPSRPVKSRTPVSPTQPARGAAPLSPLGSSPPPSNSGTNVAPSKSQPPPRR